MRNHSTTATEPAAWDRLAFGAQGQSHRAAITSMWAARHRALRFPRGERARDGTPGRSEVISWRRRAGRAAQARLGCLCRRDCPARA
jgi:hypothetical protein